jgi:hypothetical protein
VIAVVVVAGAPDRAAEGLRAGVGLGLRGEPVRVIVTGAAARWLEAGGGRADPRVVRALATLAELGRPAELLGEAEARAAAAGARVAEVWTDGGGDGGGGGARRIELLPDGGAVAPAAEADLGPVVERIFAAGRALVW